jgi:hypothetical protein
LIESQAKSNNISQNTEEENAFVRSYVLSCDHLLLRTSHVTVWHYTSVSAFLEIIKSNELWLSHNSFLNDKKEHAYALNLLRTIAQTEKKYHNIVRQLLQFSSNASQAHVFVLSFCESGDLLSQWIGYGQGVSVGFNVAGLEASFRSF